MYRNIQFTGYPVVVMSITVRGTYQQITGSILSPLFPLDLTNIQSKCLGVYRLTIIFILRFTNMYI